MLAARLTLSVEAASFRTWIVSRLREVLASACFDVRVIGSHAYGLAIPCSSLDLEVYSRDEHDLTKEVLAIHDIRRLISTNPRTLEIFNSSLTKAFCLEDIKYLELTTWFDELRIRIYVDHPTARKDASEICKLLKDHSPYLLPVCKVLAQWFHVIGALKPETGGLNIYNIVHMTVDLLSEYPNLVNRSERSGKKVRALFMQFFYHYAYAEASTIFALTLPALQNQKRRRADWREFDLPVRSLQLPNPSNRHRYRGRCVGKWPAIQAQMTTAAALLVMREQDIDSIDVTGSGGKDVLRDIVRVPSDGRLQKQKKFAERWAKACGGSRFGPSGSNDVDIALLLGRTFEAIEGATEAQCGSATEMPVTSPPGSNADTTCIHLKLASTPSWKSVFKSVMGLREVSPLSSEEIDSENQLSAPVANSR
ncbi:hypothetical protein DFJ77DRAFT_256594 [Powellomyces hirtus]|nr:hypothetical protein DFJ77DRAFT_256594 [Powellomyces hirtus]